MLGADLALPGQHHGPFEGALQFPHVARPVVGQQDGHGFLAQVGYLLAHAGGALAHEMHRQQRDILAAFAQRRELHGDDAQSVVEFRTEHPGAGHAAQVALGGGDQAHVHASGAPFFEQLQQARLGVGGQRVDFVQKESAAVSLFAAGLQAMGMAGRRCRCGREEFAFHPRLVESGAVGLDKKLVPAGAQGVHGARRQSFARARFADDQHRQVGVGHFLELGLDPLYRSARADPHLADRIGSLAFSAVAHAGFPPSPFTV